MSVTMEKIVSLCKRRGFVFPGSEIYGGLSNSWDYGPLGSQLKRNIEQAWWRRFVASRSDIVGIDPAIFMNPKVWEASGHVANFNDAQVDCKQCKHRWRADHLIQEKDSAAKVEGKSLKELDEMLVSSKVACPHCGTRNFTPSRVFNLLFKTFLGVLEGEQSVVYLRGEMAQGMFVNFKSVVESSRMRLPFGIAASGRVFRNEITPGNFTFRTLEFDLQEFEYFVNPKEWEKWFEYWLGEMWEWTRELGFSKEKLRVREHSKEELSHYSTRTVDIEYETPMGWKELFGLAYRTDYDLRNHSEKSGKDLRYIDLLTNEKFFPHVIEPTFGLTRTVLISLLNAYHEVEGGRTMTTESVKEIETVLRLPYHLAPVQVALFPLSRKEVLQGGAHRIEEVLRKKWIVEYDDTGSIGKRYRRQDEIGTPFCITYDFESENDKKVTVRDRDSMKQDRISIDQVESYLREKF
ncbi:MAG: glycine--tRNA ligase [Deltaproteobacteria bacterium]|nr:glycine--tRNA ligase [Deltaproteobacteria bacterium]